VAIVQCLHCKFIREIGNQHEGKQAKCPLCQTPLYVQNSIALVTDLTEEISQLHGEILQLKQDARLARDETAKLKKTIQQIRDEAAKGKKNVQLPSDEATKSKNAAKQPKSKKTVQPTCDEAVKSKKNVQLTRDEIAKVKENVQLTCDEATKIRSGYAFANLDSSPIFENYDDIIQWFNAKQIEVEPNQAAMDISGFFDEIAVQLGDNYAVLGELCEKIKRSQRKWGKFTLNLVSYDQKNLQIVIDFLKELYDNAFITRYVYDKMNKRVYISLQTTPKITNFFNGDWLEWYVLMKVATLLVDKKVKFSCLRGFHILFPDSDINEIDLFFLINGKLPLWIECKSGEFRQFIDKYSKLRKRLKLEKSNALLLVLGMPDEKVVGLTNTFELTVVNENNFLKQIEQKIAPV